MLECDIMWQEIKREISKVESVLGYVEKERAAYIN